MAPVDFAGDFEDINYPSNLDKLRASGTRWLRMWIRWDVAEPSPGSYNAGYMGLIDEQIYRAVLNGFSVILVTWHYPRWSNYTQNVDPATYAYSDRITSSGSLKPLEMGLPLTQLGTNQAWGSWINFLIGRYKPHGAGKVVIEIINEPNLQPWPQMNSSGDTIIHYKVAEMINTAITVNAWHGSPIHLAGPATSDHRRNNSREATHYFYFIPSLVSALNSFNQRGNPAFIWTHHNYIDVETNTGDGANVARNALVNWWRGWSPSGNYSGSDPGVMITEGGARVNRVGSLAAQAARMQAAWDRSVTAPGIGMLTNYELHSVPSYDTGLREPLPGGAERPVWHTFRSWPGSL